MLINNDLLYNNLSKYTQYLVNFCGNLNQCHVLRKIFLFFFLYYVCILFIHLCMDINRIMSSKIQTVTRNFYTDVFSVFISII